MTADSGVDSEGAGGARAPPEFGGSEKRIEREIDNLLLRAPLDLKSYLRRWLISALASLKRFGEKDPFYKK